MISRYSFIITLSRVALAFHAFTFIYSQNVSITGSVTNPANKPVKKAVVTLRNLKDEIVQEGITNRKGEFKLEDIDPKFYYLVIEHVGDGSKRIKINPRKNKNEDLDLSIYLEGQEETVECYLFGDDPPTSFDPILNIKELEVNTGPERLMVSWKDIRQAKLYVLYENGEKVYVGEETRFEKDVYPGTEYCYEIQASGNYGLHGEMSPPSCKSAPTQSPRDIKIEPLKNSLSLSWGSTEGAVSYKVYRNDEELDVVNTTSFFDPDLEFSNEYYYKITAIDGMRNESAPSIEIKSKTHEFVDVPILSSMNSKTNIVLIWNEVEGVDSYNVYRNT